MCFIHIFTVLLYKLQNRTNAELFIYCYHTKVNNFLSSIAPLIVQKFGTKQERIVLLVFFYFYFSVLNFFVTILHCTSKTHVFSNHTAIIISFILISCKQCALVFYCTKQEILAYHSMIIKENLNLKFIKDSIF